MHGNIRPRLLGNQNSPTHCWLPCNATRVLHSNEGPRSNTSQYVQNLDHSGQIFTHIAFTICHSHILWNIAATTYECEKTSYRPMARKEEAAASRQCTISLLLHQGTSDQKQHNYGHTHTLFAWLGSCDMFLFLNRRYRMLTQLRWSTQKGRRYSTSSQITDSRMHFKNGRSAGCGVYERKGTVSRITVASDQKVSFSPDGSTSRVNYWRQWFMVCSCRWTGC
jgi:hypothetical protein